MTFNNNIWCGLQKPYHIRTTVYFGESECKASLKEQCLIVTYSIACSVQNIRKKTVNIILAQGRKQ